jgi:large subunit ribosomal protein L17
MMFRNMVTSLFDKERIQTTLERAKAVRPIAERMITLGKRESLHARRQALAFIKDPAVVSKLFDAIAPRFSERPGGYTRIIRLGNRDGDGAQMALIELIGSEYKPDKKEGKGAKKASKATAAADEKKESKRTKKASKEAAVVDEKKESKGTRKASKRAAAGDKKKETAAADEKKESKRTKKASKVTAAADEKKESKSTKKASKEAAAGDKKKEGKSTKKDSKGAAAEDKKKEK